MGIGSDQSSVRSWHAQPIKELSSAAGRRAGRGCALIRQLANTTRKNVVERERREVCIMREEGLRYGEAPNW